MPTTLPKKKSGDFGLRSEGASSENGLLWASVFLALVFSISTAVLPAESVLPVVAIVVILSGMVVGASAKVVARSQGFACERLLDIAGVLVLFGFAAAMISDKSDALRLLAGIPGQ